MGRHESVNWEHKPRDTSGECRPKEYVCPTVGWPGLDEAGDRHEACRKADQAQKDMKKSKRNQDHSLYLYFRDQDNGSMLRMLSRRLTDPLRDSRYALQLLRLNIRFRRRARHALKWVRGNSPFGAWRTIGVKRIEGGQPEMGMRSSREFRSVRTVREIVASLGALRSAGPWLPW